MVLCVRCANTGRVTAVSGVSLWKMVVAVAGGDIICLCSPAYEVNEECADSALQGMARTAGCGRWRN